MIPMDEAKDRCLGKIGDDRRDKYERELNPGDMARKVGPVIQFLCNNGFEQSGPYTFSNKKCEVSFGDHFTTIELLDDNTLDKGTMYHDGYSIYWIIGVLTYYGLIDKNFIVKP